MNKRFVKCISVLLSFAMFFQIAEPALASLIEDDAFIETEEIPIGMTGETGDVLVLKDAEGNETTVDESWEEVYPFGAFAFGTSGGSAREGEDRSKSPLSKLSHTSIRFPL